MTRLSLVALLSGALALTGFTGLPALQGELVYVLGDVSVRQRGAPVEARIGMLLGPGDVIETGADGTAVLRLGSDAELKLRENTLLALDSLGEEPQVNLSRGGLFSRVTARLAGRFRVVTETAVAGVRGTEFFVAYGRRIDEYPDIWLCVNEGSVEVAILGTGRRLVVDEGLGINIVGGVKLTPPRPYRWTRKLNWNADPLRGEVSDRTDLEQAYSDLLDQDYD